MRGLNVFEGIRGYWNSERRQLYLFKSEEHFARLRQSANVLRIKPTHDTDALRTACVELLRALECEEDVHLRVVVYVGESEDTFGLDPTGTQVGAFIFAFARSRAETLDAGISVAVSSWERIRDHSMPPRVKAGANYLNSRLAEAQAKTDGYDSAVLLDDRGKVTELPGACVMLVRNNRLITPAVTDSILESITRSTLLDLARRELGIAIEERPIDRTELYVADELLACGTNEEVTPIVSVDRYLVGDGMPGQITRALQNSYFDLVRGTGADQESSLLPIYPERNDEFDLAGHERRDSLS